MSRVRVMSEVSGGFVVGVFVSEKLVLLLGVSPRLMSGRGAGRVDL